MRPTLKSSIITATAALLLGASLALSSAGVVSGASSLGNRLGQLATTCSSSSGFCLTESNTFRLAAQSAASERSMPTVARADRFPERLPQMVG